MQFAPGIAESRQYSGTRLIMLAPVTTVAAIVLGVWLVILSLRVISQRRNVSVSLGDGGNEILSRRIRAQANLSEYAPTGLILLLLAELQGTQLRWLVICASLLVLGRLAHGYALSFTQSNARARISGMLMTFTGIIMLAAANVWNLLNYS